jgi:aspartate racemase
MLASPALKKAGLYKGEIFPDEDEKILGVIRAVKANALTAAHRRDYAEIAASLDVDAYLIACTELSVIGPPDAVTKPVVDALDVLVEEVVSTAL